MSGLEVVGIALGAFPLIINLLEHYEDGFRTVEGWRFYRLGFTTLVNMLNREKIIFQQHIEGLLRIISDSEYDIKALMSDFKCDAWKDPNLTLKLKRKMSHETELENYLAGIEAIHTNLDRLAARLERCRPPLKGTGPEPRNQKGFQLQKSFRRLQLSLSRKKWSAQIVELGAQIDRVDKLMSNAETLETGRQTNDVAMPKVFKEIRVQASSLHKALVKGWDCDCRDEHCFQLLLSKSPPEVSEHEPSSRVLCVAFPPREKGRGWKIDEAMLENDDWFMTDTSIMPAPAWTSDGTTIAGEDSEVASISTVSETPISSVWTLEKQQTTETQVTTHSTVSSMAESQRSYPTKEDKSHTKESQLKTQQLKPLLEHPNAISNLCSRLFGDAKVSSLGYLSHDEGCFHVLRPGLSSGFPFPAPEYDKVVRLTSLLEDGTKNKSGTSGVVEPTKLSRLTRMALALRLANALLQLYPSPWLRNSWSKDDIWFFQLKSGQVLTEVPFLLWDMAWDKCQQKAKAAEDPRNALLSLGILIMELWFGETIETRPFWRRHYGPDGNESESTRLTAAISWQKKAAADGGSMLHDTTHRCIWGNFGATTLDFEDTRFVGAVYDGVIRPLENMLRLMWPSAVKQA